MLAYPHATPPVQAHAALGPALYPVWPRTLKPADGITLGYDAESTLQQLTKKHTAHHNWGIVNENIYGQEIPPPSTVGWVNPNARGE